MMRFFWISAGFIALGIGIAGIVLPLVPTVPLVLLASFCFAKSSKRLHSWLVSHKTFGPMIHDWSRNCAISRNAKRAATISIIAVIGISIALGVPQHVIIIQIVTLSCVLRFIWTRPNS